MCANHVKHLYWYFMASNNNLVHQITSLETRSRPRFSFTRSVLFLLPPGGTKSETDHEFPMIIKKQGRTRRCIPPTRSNEEFQFKLKY